MRFYDVHLTYSTEAESPEQAAEDFREYLKMVKLVEVRVERTGRGEHTDETEYVEIDL